MPWVKLHTDILDDPKLLRAARKGARGLELLPWLLAFAKRANDDGRLTVGDDAAEPEEIARGIPGAKVATVAACLASAAAIGVLEDDAGVLRFARWESRAGKPSDARESVRERVARSRTRQRESAHAEGDTEGVTDESVTPPVTPSIAIQGDTPALRNAPEGEEKEREKEMESRNNVVDARAASEPERAPEQKPAAAVAADPDWSAVRDFLPADYRRDLRDLWGRLPERARPSWGRDLKRRVAATPPIAPDLLGRTIRDYNATAETNSSVYFAAVLKRQEVPADPLAAAAAAAKQRILASNGASR